MNNKRKSFFLTILNLRNNFSGMQIKLINLKKPLISSLFNHFTISKPIFCYYSSSPDSTNPKKTETKVISKFFSKFFAPETSRAPLGYNRYLMAIPCFLIHICIGAPYAWSIVVGLLSFPYLNN